MDADVAEVVPQCISCQQGKQRTPREVPTQQNIMAQLPTLKNPFDLLGLDLVVLEAHATVNKMKYILVGVDYLARFAVAAALPNQEATTVLKAIVAARSTPQLDHDGYTEK